MGIQTLDDLAQLELDTHREPFDPRRWFDSVMTGETEVQRPTDPVPVLSMDRNGQLVVMKARWWLLMEQEEGHWKPNQKLATFNSKIEKVLNQRGTIHERSPKSFRVIIPATAYVEWHEKKPHVFSREDGLPILFGAVAKAYPMDSGFELGVSIVTLPGHPKTAHIHAKSLPLMLEDSQVIAWLDRNVPFDYFKPLAEPRIATPLRIQPVASLKTMAVQGEFEIVVPDARTSNIL